MAARRSLSWTSALRDIKDDRASRPEVRYEAVKSFTRGIDLCAWRGRSGRRYACRVLPLDIDASDFRNAVMIASDDDNTVLDVSIFPSAAVIESMIANGATKLSAHMLADSTAERAAIARDLRPMPVEAF